MELSIFDKIRDWAKARELYKKGDPKTQLIKLMEETGELSKAEINQNHLEIIDAVGDIVVVLTNYAAMHGLNIEDCIASAYEEIKDRKGGMSNGSFVKSN